MMRHFFILLLAVVSIAHASDSLTQTRIETHLLAPKEAPKLLDTNGSKTVQPQIGLLKPVQEYPVSTSTIGLILPLSGPYAVYGERVLITVQMALRMPFVKFNGRPFMVQTNGNLNLVIGDSRADVHVADANRFEFQMRRDRRRYAD